MKAVKDSTLDELEETAAACAKAIRAYLVYQGTNKDYEKKARVAAAGISSFARTRASESNREELERRDNASITGKGFLNLRPSLPDPVIFDD